MSGIEHNKLQEKNNDPQMQAILKDKEKTLKFLGELVRRDWCGQVSHNTEKDYEDFASKHSRGILKPLDKCGGEGIRIVDTDSGKLGCSLYEFCKKIPASLKK